MVRYDICRECDVMVVLEAAAAWTRLCEWNWAVHSGQQRARVCMCEPGCRQARRVVREWGTGGYARYGLFGSEVTFTEIQNENLHSVTTRLALLRLQ